MKRLNSISLFRIILLLVISTVFNNIWTLIGSITVLTVFNYKETVVYLSAISILYLSYKLQNTELFLSLDIINPVTAFLKNRILAYKDETQNILKTILFNEYDYSNIYNLSYGLTSYYLVKTVGRKKTIYGFILLVIFSLMFGFNRKYLIFLSDSLLKRFINDTRNRNIISIFMILIIGPDIIHDKSLFIVLLIKMFFLFKSEISFEMYLFIVESILFGYTDLITLFFFKYLILIRAFIYISSIIVLLIPSLENVYLRLIELYSFINNSLTIKINGSLNVISLIFIICFIYVFKIRNSYIQITLVSLYLIFNLNVPYTSVSFIDVGQGDSILIRDSFNRNVTLIDTGSKYSYYKLEKYLKGKSIRNIDYLVVTHEDEDHSGNINNLKNDFSIKETVVDGKDICSGDIILKYLNLGEYDNDNDNSFVYFTDINGISFLFTGDISRNAELSYIEKYGYSADILKVSHHGSDTASSNLFISTVLPEISVISTNGKYNHPSQKTLNTLENYISKTLITKEEGNIEFIFLYRLCIVKTNSEWFVII